MLPILPAPGLARSTMDGFERKAPSVWLAAWLPDDLCGLRALDVAAGYGRHACLMAARGATVLAVDRAAEAVAVLSAIPGVQALQADLEDGAWPLPEAAFDVVLVSRYLYRPRWAQLVGGLAPGGWLYYETFMVGQAQRGHPRNPDYLLRENELFERAVASGLQVRCFEQGDVAGAFLQRLVAYRPLVTRARSR